MIRAALAAAKLAARIPRWLTCPAGSPLARLHECRAHAGLTRDLGVIVETAGAPRRGATLFVANHISWSDIAVLGGLLDADFVARDDIVGWPLLGPLARRVAPVLVARERRLGSGTQVDAIRDRLRAGRSVILFAEGTTSDGEDVLRFRSSLLAAGDCADAIQPVMLRYLAIDGSALTPRRMREIAWIGDDAFLANVRALVREPVRARVAFLEPIADRANRKLVATAARAAIRAAYAAAPNRCRYRAEMASTDTTRNTSTVLNW